jgi:hypothetical protein
VIEGGAPDDDARRRDETFVNISDDTLNDVSHKDF